LTLKTKQHGPDTIPALLRWLKGFIVHFLAQRTLEQCDFGFPTGKVAFSIIAVDGSLLGIPTSWSVMKDIISETMGDQDHNQVIKELEARIKGAPPRPNAKIVLATLGLKESRDAAFRDGNGPLAELCEVW